MYVRLCDGWQISGSTLLRQPSRRHDCFNCSLHQLEMSASVLRFRRKLRRWAAASRLYRIAMSHFLSGSSDKSANALELNHNDSLCTL